MTALNNEVRHIFKVVDQSTGEVVTGLVTADFTLTLQREDSGALTAASEVVAVTEISGGLYWVTYTPTAAAGVYYLTIASANYTTSPAQFQDDITGSSAAAGSTGPYLTTRANTKTALGISGTAFDDAIDALLPQVTDLVQTYCNRIFVEQEFTEYYGARGAGNVVLVLRQFPVSAVSTVHVSLALPRVYGADELLVDGEAYMLSDDDAGLLQRTDGSYWPVDPRAVKVVYTAGYSTIPGDLERAAIEIIAMKMYKAGAGGGANLYPYQGVAQGEGTVTGIRLSDIPPQTYAVLNAYRDRGAR